MIRSLISASLVVTLVLSITLNAALVVSEVAYNVAYGIISNAVSILYEGAELKSSLGWRNKQVSKNFEQVKSQLHQVEVDLEKQGKELNHLRMDKAKLEEGNKLLEDQIQAKRVEISALENERRVNSSTIKSKNAELDELSGRLTQSQNDLKNSDLRIKALLKYNEELTTKKILVDTKVVDLEKNLDESKAVTSKLKQTLAKSSDEVSILTKQVTSLNAQVLQSSDELIALNRSLPKVLDAGAPGKVVRETTDRVTKRIAKRVSRNIAAMPFESVPIAGVAITVGTIYLEIQDACTTLSEFDEMISKLELEEEGLEADKSFCSLSKDDLLRLMTNRTDDFEECIATKQSDMEKNVDAFMECLPAGIDDVGIPEPYVYEMPEQPEL